MTGEFPSASQDDGNNGGFEACNTMRLLSTLPIGEKGCQFVVYVSASEGTCFNSFVYFPDRISTRRIYLSSRLSPGHIVPAHVTRLAFIYFPATKYPRSSLRFVEITVSRKIAFGRCREDLQLLQKQ
ncbi:hypothetical protein P153DRAFT_8649 [Dothidotthia symphoricarpi CBS 119687]|uniref:Uncharacterized protein n=1 Tax=Dothidotthia symphoricarpi CBS 119687 TaxID=1392245 RepID=A0A6A6AUU4_9PLEO|nr:uncharacterized protein P153DRAFT_8649 [Dothidotthia symphoricarpi CBS 119687]KAF2134735.1 hypothetical protein P153DRAFT_8649 [Dothidotthia symphoricarpi CBS 119687]